MEIDLFVIPHRSVPKKRDRAYTVLKFGINLHISGQINDILGHQNRRGVL